MTAGSETGAATPPRLFIEEHLPVAELGIESVRERAVAMDLPPLFALHVWWARRPLVASTAAVLAGVLPAWTPELPKRFPGRRELADPETYRSWFLELCGIWGDPVRADALMRVAKAVGTRIPNPYTYKQAYKNNPSLDQVGLLHAVLEATWGCVPSVLDPMAGGGSIPFAAVRYRLTAHANDLNAVAAGVLRASVAVPARYGLGLQAELKEWGEVLVERLRSRLEPFFPSLVGEKTATFIFARTVACPRTGKTVPLVSDWSLRRDADPVAVRLLTHRGARELDEPEFEVAKGGNINFDPKRDATFSRGKGISPWDGLAIDAKYIKAEAQAGRMGETLYAIAVRTAEGRDFRVPTQVDLDALAAAEAELTHLEPVWTRDDVLPAELIPEGNKTREPHNYGMRRWRDMFTARQLLSHGCFIEEFRRLIPEIREAIDDRERADAVLALLAMMQGKAISWNGRQSRWDQSRQKVAQAFDIHAFPFKSTFAEFEAGSELFAWAHEKQLLRAYRGLCLLLSREDEHRRPLPSVGAARLADLSRPDGREEAVSARLSNRATMTYPAANVVNPEGQARVAEHAPSPLSVAVTRANAGNLDHLADGSQTLVCIDPPYHDNVMYAELADYFYVWEKRTLSMLWPELFVEALTNKRDEAVANHHRFAQAGRRAKELADSDYTAKMAAIFAECRRVLDARGAMVVMFTHKRAEAWDSLGAALLQAGFTIGTSWPVRTESEQSLHQARQNSAASTILLTCRPRATRAAGEGRVYLDDIEADIRRAAGDALARSYDQGLSGVDLLLSTYGPALSVLSGHWPVHAADATADGTSRLLRPEEALDVARTEVVRRQRARLVGRESDFDAVTDFTVLAWSTFGARKFPFDEARRLALAIGGLEVDELTRRRILSARSGTVELVEPRARLRRGATRDNVGGVDLERFDFGALIDAVHTALYIVDEDGPAAAKRWLDARDLSGNQRFADCLQALVSAVPRSKTEGAWNVREAELLDRLIATSFPGIDIPAEEDPAETVKQTLPHFDV